MELPEGILEDKEGTSHGLVYAAESATIDIFLEVGSYMHGLPDKILPFIFNV